MSAHWKRKGVRCPVGLILTAGLLAVSAGQLAFAEPAMNRQGKLKGTAGVSSLSGASGGGLTPWATLSTYASDGQQGANLFVTHAYVNNYELQGIGAAVTIDDRWEVAFARHNFTIKTNQAQIRQDKFSLRYKVAGDLIYGIAPQVTIGLEHGRLKDTAIASALGAQKSNGTDVILSAGKVWIAGIASRTTLLNANVRYSNANQFGLLGYGGQNSSSRFHAEWAGAMFITRDIALGAEYRHKPDNLAGVREDSAWDVFAAWFPNKHWSVTAAWVSLGDIAGAPDQQGFYISLQATL